MRKELILEDAGSQLEDWCEAYVDKLATQIPKAVVLPMGHTIKIARRGQSVWIAMHKRNSEDVRVVTTTRSTLIPLGIIFLVIGAIYLVAFAASYMSSLSFYYSNSFYSSYYPPSYLYILPYIPVIGFFMGFGIAFLKTNKTKSMQSLALQLARETWLSFSRRTEAKVFSRPVPRSAPPKTPITTPPNEQDRTLGNYCMHCGTRVEKPGAKFCGNCGKSLFY